MKKKVDGRLRTLMDTAAAQNHRSFVVLVGDNARNQVVTLHYLLTKSISAAAAAKTATTEGVEKVKRQTRPNVLWCYKTQLHLSSHRKKRMKQVKKMVARGVMEKDAHGEAADPFALFVASTSIRYCYYHESSKVLGQTFGMLVLQDFEAITPNLLARTIETVQGGGLVVLLLDKMSSLRQLYALAMDAHARFKTESHADVVGRFNERFILSLGANPSCAVLDDELNILPISSHIRKASANVADALQSRAESKSDADLRDLCESWRGTEPAASLMRVAKTSDQGKALLTFLDAASEKTLRSTVALTAGRGRGKSAAMGIAIAGALAFGYANIFVTAPSPENLKTLFEFIFKGLDALDYKEHLDYSLVESSNPAMQGCVVRVNVFRAHRQTVQFVLPHHVERISQAELLVIDEAAAIPLPLVRKLLGPYLVFMCSTVTGYEGTGRSLSLKLLQQLREQAATPEKDAGGRVEASGRRSFREITLEEPIRYSAGDACETWLHQLLCLDATEHLPRAPVTRLPHPSECDLYCVNRDTLFSFHKASEQFLQRIMALYVAGHYKNSPNDLQLMADAPAHQLFVLLPPVDEEMNALPHVLAVVQIAFEGAISRKSVQSSLASGNAPQGDLIPWTVSQQFQDSEFPRLSGARIVRIAVHPEMQRAGYGTRACELLIKYFEGAFVDPTITMGINGGGRDGAKNGDDPNRKVSGRATDKESDGLRDEVLKPRAALPPLLMSLQERPPERLHWIGSSFGVTKQLYNFWKSLSFNPVYLRQTANDVTGENTLIVIRSLRRSSSASEDVVSTADADLDLEKQWLPTFVEDFRSRFLALLGHAFSSMPLPLALSILDPKLTFSADETARGPVDGVGGVRSLSGAELSVHDLKRLSQYASNLLDYHVIVDLLPGIAAAYFRARLPVSLSYVQAAILVALGLQRRTIDDVEEELGLPVSQVLALFNKAIRKIHTLLHAARETAVIKTMAPSARAAIANVDASAAAAAALAPHAVSLDEDLAMAGRESLKATQRALLQPEMLEQYAIGNGIGDEEDEAADAWADADAAVAAGKVPESGLVSVKGSGLGKKRTDAKEREDRKRREEEKMRKSHGSSEKKKKKQKRSL